MLSIVIFALVHNALVAVLYFFYIGIYRIRGFMDNLGIQIGEAVLLVATGGIVAKFYEIPPRYFFIHLALLFLFRSKLSKIFPFWTDAYRKFYGFLVLTMALYLAYKLVFMGEILLTGKSPWDASWHETSLDFIQSLLAGQAFFIFLLFSETFVLVSSAYAIYDSVSLAADNRPNQALPEAARLIDQAADFPMVSLHVPVCREPPEMVLETLSALAEMDYPNFEVIVASNNTRDAALWQPVASACQRLGFKFLHFETLPGYKAGALNRALLETNPKAQLIGVIDSDYVVQPGFLTRVAPLFRDSAVAFAQTSQDYRNRNDSAFLRMGYPVYKLFFDVVMVARARRNSIMFAGTMGLLRKDVLRQIGGWNEQCVAEDAEASLRILNLGYKGAYLHETWGYGLLPTDFHGCEKQWSRWMTGGIQVVRLNQRILFHPKSALTFAQRWDYAVGGIMSFGAFLTINSALLLAGFAITIAVAPELMQAVFASLSTSLLIFSFFITLTAMMVILTFKWNMNCSAKCALGAFIFVMGLSWARARAVWLALTRRKLAFERTAKFRVTPSLLVTLWNSRYPLAIAGLIAFFNLLVFQNYAIRPPGLIIISFWQEITYLAAIALSILSLKKS